jgi:hypothetical protein
MSQRIELDLIDRAQTALTHLKHKIETDTLTLTTEHQPPDLAEAENALSSLEDWLLHRAELAVRLAADAAIRLDSLESEER